MKESTKHIIKGMRQTLVICPPVRKYVNVKRSAAESLSGDWKAIGDDFIIVLNKFGKQHHKKDLRLLKRRARKFATRQPQKEEKTS